VLVNWRDEGGYLAGIVVYTINAVHPATEQLVHAARRYRCARKDPGSPLRWREVLVATLVGVAFARAGLRGPSKSRYVPPAHREHEVLGLWALCMASAIGLRQTFTLHT